MKTNIQINAKLVQFFEGEIANEREGGICPSTLSSAIDSLLQGGSEVFGLSEDAILELLSLRNRLKGETLLAEVLA